MFLVFNKDKIISFLVATCTVIILFMMTSIFTKTPEVIETSTNIEQNKYDNSNLENYISNNINSNE